MEKKLAEDRVFAKSVQIMGKTLIRNKKPKIVNWLSLSHFPLRRYDPKEIIYFSHPEE